MANYSKLLSLISGRQQTIDFSLVSNILELGGGGLQMDGSTSGHVVISASAITATYSIVWPAAQAASSGYTLSNDGTGVLSWVPSASGSVTAISVNTANGFAGSSSGGSTPALTLSTTITGVLKGNGTAISAATPGTDYVIPSGSITGTAGNVTATSNSTLTTLTALSLPTSQLSGFIALGSQVSGSLPILNGGTGQTTASGAFAALSPMSTAGDIIYEDNSPAPAALPIGSNGQVLTVVSGLPAWQTSTTGANQSLSNLTSPTSINQSLIPASGSGGQQLGTAAHFWGPSYINILMDGLGTPAAHVFNRILNDSSGAASIDWDNRFLFDSSGSDQLSWDTTGVAFPQLTANTVPYINGSNYLTSSAVTPTELGYLSGVTSAIQTQLNGKLSLTGGTMSGAINMGSNKITFLTAGSIASDAVNYGQVILADGSNDFIANQSMGGNKLTNLANGTAGTDAVNFSQLTAISSGLVWLPAINDPDLLDDSLSTPPDFGQVIFTVTALTTATSPGTTYTNNSNTYTVTAYAPVGSTTLTTSGYASPTASGTLTYATGSGQTPIIAFSGFTSSAAYSIVYIIAAGGTGAWTGLDGHAVWWDGFNWIDISTGNTANAGFGTAVQVGDRFLVASATAAADYLLPGGGLTGHLYDIAQVLTNVPGSFTYTFTTPVAGYAVSDTDLGSQHFGSSFTFSSATSTWIDFAGPSKAVAGNALAYAGNTLNVLADTTSINFNGSNELQIATGGVTTAKLGVITDNVTLDQSGAGATLEVKTGGIGTSQLASASVTAAKLGAVTDGITLDQSGSGSTLEVKAGGIGTTQLGTITDGVTLDQSGAGSTLEVKNAGISATQLATGAFDQVTIKGGAGTPAFVASAPTILITAIYGGAATLVANTTYALRWGMPDNGETVGKLYLADWDTSSFDLFWVAGLYNSLTSTATGVTITIVNKGPITLGSSDSTFGSTDQGKPVWLGSSGSFSPNSTFSPTSGDANEKLGIAQSATIIYAEFQMMGVS